MIAKGLIKENRKRLLAEKARLEKLLGKIAEPNPDIEGDYKAIYTDMGDDADENATEVSEYEANVGEERRLEEKLGLVNDALKRIDDGTYGVDAKTGKEISEERLRAVPEALSDIIHEEE